MYNKGIGLHNPHYRKSLNKRRGRLVSHLNVFYDLSIGIKFANFGTEISRKCKTPARRANLKEFYYHG